MGNNQKRIVCDIDDTISITLNRDWEHARPVQDVIDKINNLYDQGWEIYLVTARGNLSCKTREEADQKYRKQIETWLAKHGVKYTLLSFQKYLAAYYIDDKGLTPEEFVKLDIRNLQDGWSGATVELRDGRVYKTHPDSLMAGEWYKVAQSFFNVPQIHSLIGQTLCMEYIEATSKVIKMPKILKLLESMAYIPYVSEKENKYAHYVTRVMNHIELAKDTVPSFKEWLSYQTNARYCYYDSERTFCHGDLTLENIIIRNEEMYLIDPIYEANKDTYSSWLLDASKFLYSLRLHNMMVEHAWIENELLTRSVDIINLKLLEASHCIRVYKYAPIERKLQVTEMFTNIMNEIEEICKDESNRISASQR